MAVAKVQIPAPNQNSQRPFFSVELRRPCEIYALTKLAGDTTYTLACDKIKRVTKVTVYDSTGAVIAGATYTVGGPSTDLAVLGGGTLVFVVIEGPRHST
jgi:hypothetical protein